MKRYIILIIASFFMLTVYAQEIGIDRKVLHDCTVTFDISVVDTSASYETVKAISKAVKISYISGNNSRNDMIHPLYKQSEIYKEGTDTVVVLKEISGNKYITYLDRRTTMKPMIDSFGGIQFITTRESKNILGYECIKAQAQFPDGNYAYVLYAPTIEPSNKDFELQFKKIPGFVLEYESFIDDNKTKVRYTPTSLDTSAVPKSKFDWPKSGYRVLPAKGR